MWGLGRSEVEISLLSFTGSVCDVHASLPLCTSWHSSMLPELRPDTPTQPSTPHLPHSRISKLVGTYLGYQKEECEIALMLPSPYRTSFCFFVDSRCVCLPNILFENSGHMSALAVDTCLQRV